MTRMNTNGNRMKTFLIEEPIFSPPLMVMNFHIPMTTMRFTANMIPMTVMVFLQNVLTASALPAFMPSAVSFAFCNVGIVLSYGRCNVFIALSMPCFFLFFSYFPSSRLDIEQLTVHACLQHDGVMGLTVDYGPSGFVYRHQTV